MSAAPINVETPLGVCRAANNAIQAAYDAGMERIAAATRQLSLSADMWEARLKAEQAQNLATYNAALRAST